MELNHSLYNENAFLTLVFELDFFIKKGKQKNIPKEEAMKEFSLGLIHRLKKKDDNLLQELFEQWYSLANEKAKFNEESLQTRLVRFFSTKRFYIELISSDPEGFFKRIVKTRNHLVHPKLGPHSDVHLPVQVETACV
jgi:hypothetical protein